MCGRQLSLGRMNKGDLPGRIGGVDRGSRKVRLISRMKLMFLLYKAKGWMM